MACRFTHTSPLDNRALVLKAIENLQIECATHGLKTSEKMAKSAFDACLKALAGDLWYHPSNLQTVIVAIEGLLNATVSEAESRQFYVLDESITEQHDNADTLFGPQVVDAFPNAAFDISEAGKCLSFGLWTACVMQGAGDWSAGACGTRKN